MLIFFTTKSFAQRALPGFTVKELGWTNVDYSQYYASAKLIGGIIGMLIGGIGELAPSRRSDLAKLGFKALIAGTLASYLSATLAGLLL